MPPLSLAAALALAISGPIGAAQLPGLVLFSAGAEAIRPHPHVFLAADEGFTPRSASADALFRGQIAVERAGAYRFYPISGSLRLDGRPVFSEPLALAAGTHALEFGVSRGSGPLRASIEWEGPGFEREPIPARYLFHEGTAAGIETGRMLFEDLGCANCHRSQSSSLEGRRGPHLTGIGGRVRSAWMLQWLDGPERFRPWATMPVMLDPDEGADVAAFLATLGAGTGPAEGSEPRKIHSERGRTAFQSLGCVACHGAARPLVGLGSKMTADRLAQYLQDPLGFAPDGRMPSFHLSEAEAFDLAAYLSLSRNPEYEVVHAQNGDPRAGRQLVVQAGCLACHQIDGLESAARAPGLDALDPSKGCLAEAVPSGLPRYRLAGAQRADLADFIHDYRETPDVAPAPVYDLPRRMVQLGCNACHEIDGSPPVGAVAEMAPSLGGIGEKLRPGWIERVLNSRTQNLDWQELRMPAYGSERAGRLARALAKAAGVDPGGSHEWSAGGDADRGLGMLGMDAANGGMGCIGCHGWAEFAALGEDGPNLHTAGQRLRWPWFDRWMRAPARILPGTSMPGYFAGPRTPDSTAKLANLWEAFRSARALPPPAGFGELAELSGREARPVPEDRAIVVRWDMPEATPAAFAVGLPGGVSYCFDAAETRLRYAWHGGFVDMTRTLFNKKNRETNLTETAEIVGGVFFREGPAPIRVGDRDRIPQRKFRGYRLVDHEPEFRYELDGMEVRERISATEGGIVRKFHLPRVEGKHSLRGVFWGLGGWPSRGPKAGEGADR